MIKDLFNIEHLERKIFKRHFIRNVIIDLRFSKLLKQTIFDNVEYFAEEFKNLGFDEKQNIKRIEIKMSIEQDEPTQDKTEDDIGIVFLNKTEQSQIELTENKIVYLDSQYINFDVFSGKVNKVLEIINKLSINNNKINHLGFRKINTILATEINSFNELTKYFNNTIFAPLRTDLLNFDTFNNYKDRIEVQKNNYKAIINSSCIKLHDGNFELNLDIDLIDIDIEDNFNVIEALNELNKINFDLFLSLTTDALREEMDREV